MKYFTPELYLRQGNIDNEAEFLAAQQDWENAISDYRAHLDNLLPKLQPELQLLVRGVYLHDAQVVSMHQQDEQFVIVLQPTTLPGRLVVLTYSLVEEPRILKEVLPPERCRSMIEWLYDELDLEQPEGSVIETPMFRQNILLSNGWEVALRFRSVGITRPVRVIPVTAVHAARVDDVGKRVSLHALI